MSDEATIVQCACIAAWGANAVNRPIVDLRPDEHRPDCPNAHQVYFRDEGPRHHAYGLLAWLQSKGHGGRRLKVHDIETVLYPDFCAAHGVQPFEWVPALGTFFGEACGGNNSIGVSADGMRTRIIPLVEPTPRDWLVMSCDLSSNPTIHGERRKREEARTERERKRDERRNKYESRRDRQRASIEAQGMDWDDYEAGLYGPPV